MREFINYAVEANLMIAIFIVAYALLLRKETDFRFARIFMLSGLVIALILPCVTIKTQRPLIPTLETVMPSNWLPAVDIYADTATTESTSPQAFDVWSLIGWTYIAGIIIFGARAARYIWQINRLIRRTPSVRSGRIIIVELPDNIPTFSFFNVICLGRADTLDPIERNQIIEHETAHASRYHSVDILLITLAGVVFWFNPIILVYKKILVQLHEYEADARAAHGTDADGYCSLLARAALRSIHFPVASHFNQSLTLKRINMIRTIKKKLSTWKLVTIAFVIAGGSALVACQDQLNEVANSTITQTDDVPPEVRQRMNDYNARLPDAKLTYMTGAPDDIDRFVASPGVSGRVVYTYNDPTGIKGVILTDVVQHAESLQTEDKVFMVVEQMPEFPGGYDALTAYLSENIKYPSEDASKGISGTVYVSMVITKDGKVTKVQVLRGVSPTIDAEAIRVVSSMPSWKPGQQNGQPVDVRFNLPIRFRT